MIIFDSFRGPLVDFGGHWLSKFGYYRYCTHHFFGQLSMSLNNFFEQLLEQLLLEQLFLNNFFEQLFEQLIEIRLILLSNFFEF